MGYLNNVSTVLDAILTKKGRELLARGQTTEGTPAFNITKFALGDDEVDYSLWNVTHPDGTDYYGTVIESMPLLEPTTDINTVMRYKLTTRINDIDKMANIMSLPTSVTLEANATVTNQSGPHTPTTFNLDDGDTESYVFTVLNASVAYLTDAAGSTGTGLIPYEDTNFTDNITQTVQGANFTIHPKPLSAAPTGTNSTEGDTYYEGNTPLVGTDSPTTIVLVTGQNSGATYAMNIVVGWLA